MYNDEVLEKYDKLVYKMANKYFTPNPRFSFEDLVSQGQIAAINAANSFDPSRDVSFTTFVYNAINNEVKKFVGDNVYDLTVTEYKRRKEWKDSGSSDGLNKHKAIRIDDADISGRDSDGCYTIASGLPGPDEQAIKTESIDILMEELDNLPSREGAVVRLRWLEGKTLQEIADEMNASKQTIFGWEKRGFLRLKERVKERLGKDDAISRRM